nr:MAG TPA: hypothetical protein [Caudoviricetes sp.]
MFSPKRSQTDFSCLASFFVINGRFPIHKILM